MKLTISVAQMRVKQTDMVANLAQGERFIAEAARRGSHIVALPEMWTTGFNFKENKKLAKEQSETLSTIATFAKHYKIWVTGSVLTGDEEGNPCNTAVLFDSNGNLISRYNKVHLFSMLGENENVTSGNELVLVDSPWGKIGLTVCYDIRFPELFRSLAIQGALIIFSPMAFPYPRLEHWKILVRARAIENQLFMVGANQIGNEDFNGTEVTYFGHSTIIDPWGKTVIEAGDEQEVLLTAEIDLNLANEIRQKMRVLSDRRPDVYKLD